MSTQYRNDRSTTAAAGSDHIRTREQAGARRRKKGALRFLRRDGGARMIIAVVLLLFVVLSFSSFNLYRKKLAYDKQIHLIEEQIASEKARAEEIDAFEEYVGTDAYVEQLARDRLGLVYPNEIIFRPEE